MEVAPASTVEQVVAAAGRASWCRSSVEGEGDEAFALVEQVRATAEAQYGDAYRLAGAEVSVYDLRDTVQQTRGA